MKTVYYSTLSLSNRDHIFLQSIIVLYNSRGNAKWVSSDGIDSNLLVVGKDTDSDALQVIPNNIKVVLSFNNDFCNDNYHIIYVETPLKATSLIDKLKTVEDVLTQLSNQSIKNNNVISNNSKKLKLLQWPTAEIIAKNTAYPILSALLSKRPMGVEELVSISRKSEEICRCFVDLVVNAGCAEYISINSSVTQNNEHVNATDVSSKRGLLDKIRNRLGLFWN